MNSIASIASLHTSHLQVMTQHPITRQPQSGPAYIGHDESVGGSGTIGESDAGAAFGSNDAHRTSGHHINVTV